MKITRKQLCMAATQADQMIYQLLCDSIKEEHVFAEQLEIDILEFAEKNMPNSKRKMHSMRKTLITVAASILILFGAGVTVNAMTGGALWNFIYSFCFGTVNGAKSTFYYGEPEEFDLGDFPEGTYEAQVYYSNGLYYLGDGTEIPINRLVFINPSIDITGTEPIDVFILPESID